jgi:polyhydroxyalkanoate synthesis regulator protein
MGKQNMAMFEQAMRLFNPYRPGQGGQSGGQPAGAPPMTNGQDAPKADAAQPASDAAIDDLKRKLDELQNQLAELSKKS